VFADAGGGGSVVVSMMTCVKYIIDEWMAIDLNNILLILSIMIIYLVNI
jgi:hypothetical protein